MSERTTFVGTADGRAWVWIGFTKTPEGTRSTGPNYVETREEAERRAAAWKARPGPGSEGGGGGCTAIHKHPVYAIDDIAKVEAASGVFRQIGHVDHACDGEEGHDGPHHCKIGGMKVRFPKVHEGRIKVMEGFLG